MKTIGQEIRDQRSDITRVDFKTNFQSPTNYINEFAKSPNGTIVGVTSSGHIFYSFDSGETWERNFYAIDANGFNGVCYGNGLFVAVGNNRICYTSPDGVVWTKVVFPTLATTMNLSVTFGNGVFIVVAIGAYAASSSDGVTWTEITTLPTVWGGVNAYANKIRYGSGKFVVVGDGNKVAYSSDNGISWTLTSIANFGSDGKSTTIKSLVYAGSFFVAGGYFGKIGTSIDGVTWTLQTGLISSGWGNGSTTRVYGLEWDGTNVAAVCPSDAKFAYSPDGVTWTMRMNNASSVGASSGNSAIIQGSSGWIVGGNKIVKSDQLATSFAVKSGGFYGLSPNAFAYDGTSYSNTVIAVFGNGMVAESQGTYGVSWKSYVLPPLIGTNGGVNLFDVIWDGSNFYTNSASRFFVRNSYNSWTERTSFASVMSSSTETHIAYAYSKLIAVGSSGLLATSTDGGITWTDQSGLSSTAWGTTNAKKIIFASNKLVAFGSGGKVATSTDGVTWTNQTGLSSTAWGTTTITDVAWNGTRFVAIGGAYVATSTDGITWTTTTFTTYVMYAISASDTTFYISTNNSFYTTTDGATFYPFQSVKYESSWIGTTSKTFNVNNRFIFTNTGGYCFVYVSGKTLSANGFDHSVYLKPDLSKSSRFVCYCDGTSSTYNNDNHTSYVLNPQNISDFTTFRVTFLFNETSPLYILRPITSSGDNHSFGGSVFDRLPTNVKGAVSCTFTKLNKNDYTWKISSGESYK